LTDIALRPLRREDAEACEAVAATLPTFFGDPDGLRDMAEALRSQRGVVAERGGEVVGFLTLHPSTDEVDEITWMGVRDDLRGSGIGRQLVAWAAEDASPRPLCVLTLGPSVPDVGYESTRAFYRRVGFLPVKELSLTTWNNSHALILVRPAR
jgi:GNAT superfamily N-acetyltransferase